MTSLLTFNSTSSSDATVKLLGANSLLSNAKNPTTFIIQPPSSTNDSSLLSKRFNTSLLGGLLLKKVKSQTIDSSNVDSNQQSPNAKSSKDAVYESSENGSQLEEEAQSPTVSNFEATEKGIQNLLMPQRSLSTPIFSNTFMNKAASQPSHKQIINALDTLQKRFVEYQIANLRDTILKAQLGQSSSFLIPPLKTAENSNASPVKKIPKAPKNSSLDDEDEPEIFYGEVEYPLMHLAPKALNLGEVKVGNKPAKVKGVKAKKTVKISCLSTPSDSEEKPADSLLESLIATRAGTQRSEPEMAVNIKELSAKITEVVEKVKKSKKNNKKEDGENKSKAQKKEKANKGEKKAKGKKGQSESLLSPVAKGRMGERKKNKWQTNEESKTGSPSSDSN